MKIIYNPNYNIGFFGLEKLHPFDSRKYEHAWEVLQKKFGAKLAESHIDVDRPASDEELLLVHTQEYLDSLQSSPVIATALEMQAFRVFPAALLNQHVLQPMRWAARGSVLAAKAALEQGIAVNLSGGYHHAKPSRGEGFCIFSDIALIVRQLRSEGELTLEQKTVYIDLDAHQGNGVCYQFKNDPSFRIFDMYNGTIYPASDNFATSRVNCRIQLPSGFDGTRYLQVLREQLPTFLDSPAQAGAALAIYNAGTDVYAADSLGDLKVSAEEILERDLFVIDELRKRNLPVVMLLSGGYSQESFQLVAATVSKLLRL